MPSALTTTGMPRHGPERWSSSDLYSSSVSWRASRRANDMVALSDDVSIAAAPATPHIGVEKLSAYFGPAAAVRDVTIRFHDRSVTAIIGPSGCGKSTFLRCLNR